jgi:hypothetical protein
MVPSVNYILQAISLLACFHEILTASNIQVIRNPNIACQFKLREAAITEDQQPESQLKRCISLSSDMNQGGQAQEPSSLGVCRPRPIYSPAHSPPPELARNKRNGTNARFEQSAQPLLPSIAQATPFSEEQHVYTQLQTQLFPQMKF